MIGSRVYYVPEDDMWVHADTGFKIKAWDVRNTEPHRSEIAKRGGGVGHMYSKTAERISGDVSEPGTVMRNDGEVPIPPTNPDAEESYVNEILASANYA